MHTSLIAATAGRLLASGDPAPVTVEQPHGNSLFVLACDHGGRHIPRSLGTLGVSDTDLWSHIAWDVGAAAVARLLAERLDATLVVQNYSRLVIDCDRPLAAADSIPLLGEWLSIDGNEALDESAVAARREAIFQPYHEALAAVLDHRRLHRQATVLLSLQSFAPVYRGISRPWHINVMHHHDEEVAAAVLRLLRRDERLQIGDNEPYSLADGSSYTIPTHGEARGIPHVAVQFRHDLIADEAGQKSWAGRFANLLKQVPGMIGA